VNPLSGCLPLVIQMPILFGLYAALVAVGPLMVNAAFFWIPDLSYPQYSMGISWMPALWEAGNYQTLIAYLILPVLLVVTQFIMQKYMTPTPVGGDDSAKMTQNMSLVMTLMFGYFTLMVPAGLTLYWVTSNLLQMLQQWSVTKFFVKPATPAAAGAGASGGSAPVVVDGKATKSITTSSTAASKGSTGSSGANGTSATRTATGATSGSSSAKSSKPTNRPKAKGK
jgi:YidC/Oxa1 family membrane protein insertase